MFHPTPVIRYADPAFQQERVPQCQLRLQVSEQELALAVYDPLSAAFPLIERYMIRKGYAGLRPNEALGRILQTHALTRLPFQQVEAIAVSPHYTLVPEPLFDAAGAEHFLRLSYPANPGLSIHTHRLPGQELHVVYGWPTNLKQTVEAFFPGCHVEHYTAHLLRSLLQAAGPHEQVAVHVQDFSLDILVIRNGRLLLLNTFSFQSPDDFLYYILLAYDRHGLNREEAPLRLLGEIEEGSAIYNLCYKYIRNVEFVNRPGNYAVPQPEGEAGTMSPHFFFNLLHATGEDH